MVDHPMSQIQPLLPRDQKHQFPFDVECILLLCPAKALCKPLNVRIHNKAFDYPKSIAQNDVGRFPSHSWYLDHLGHRWWDFTLIVSDQILASCTNLLCLFSVKACWLDVLLQFFLTHLGIIFGTAIFLEEIFGHSVDTLVGTLSGKLSGDKEFKWVRKGQIIFGMGIQGA